MRATSAAGRPDPSNHTSSSPTSSSSPAGRGSAYLAPEPGDRIAVTGASGFIAMHIIAQLLEAGHTVVGTVRQTRDLSAYAHLLALPGAQARLSLAAASLTDQGAFEEALRGCAYVVHTASPYALDVQDAQRDLVDPAVQGTLHVLQAAARVGGVRRVVLTSSMAAITDEPEAEHELTEQDWNERSSLTRNPYYYSKTLAERAAWAWMEQQRPGFDLVVLNPFLVIGPSLGPGLNPSNAVFRDLATGVYPGVMSIAWGFVDVRDVARAHILALQRPAAQGRYVCAHQTMTMAQVVALLRAAPGAASYKLPRYDLACKAGDWAVKLMSYSQPQGVGSYLRTHVGKTPRFSHAKIVRELGLTFTPLERSILDTMQDLARWGHLPS